MSLKVLPQHMHRYEEAIGWLLGATAETATYM